MQMTPSPCLGKTLQVVWRGHEVRNVTHSSCTVLYTALASLPWGSTSLLWLLPYFTRKIPERTQLSPEQRQVPPAFGLWIAQDYRKGTAFHYRCHWSLCIGPKGEAASLHPGRTKTTIRKSVKLLWEINHNVFCSQELLPVTTPRTAESLRATLSAALCSTLVFFPTVVSPWLTWRSKDDLRSNASRCWVVSGDDAWNTVSDLVSSWSRPNWSNSFSKMLASLFC